MYETAKADYRFLYNLYKKLHFFSTFTLNPIPSVAHLQNLVIHC